MLSRRELLCCKGVLLIYIYMRKHVLFFNVCPQDFYTGLFFCTVYVYPSFFRVSFYASILTALFFTCSWPRMGTWTGEMPNCFCRPVRNHGKS